MGADAWLHLDVAPLAHQEAPHDLDPDGTSDGTSCTDGRPETEGETWHGFVCGPPDRAREGYAAQLRISAGRKASKPATATMAHRFRPRKSAAVSRTTCSPGSDRIGAAARAQAARQTSASCQLRRWRATSCSA